MPVEGWFVDRDGPHRRRLRRHLVACAWALDLGWRVRSRCSISPRALSGVGAGAVYGTCVGNALKWFPDRRGLAAGLTAGGFGAGAAATVSAHPRHATVFYGYEATFLWFGWQGLVVLVLAQLLRGAETRPNPPESRGAADRIAARLSAAQTSRAPVFWLLYLMFVMAGIA